MRSRQIGSDRHIGFRHGAKHCLHGGRMSLHPLQSLARIDGEGARGLLNASAVKLACGGSHRVRKTSPGVLLARFRRDARLEIGELRREERASLRAGRAVIHGRRIGLCVHRVESPQSRAGKRDHANRGPSGRRRQERHDKLRFRHRCPTGVSRAVFPANVPTIAKYDETRLGPGPEIFGYKFLLARSLTSDRLRSEIVQLGERVLEHRRPRVTSWLLTTIASCAPLCANT